MSADLDPILQERFVKALTREWPGKATKSVRYLGRRDASFLVDGYLLQAEVSEADEVSLLWCLFFQGKTIESDTCLGIDIQNRKSMEDRISEVEERLTRICICFCKNGPNRIDGLEHRCSDIDESKVADYLLEFLNYEMARNRGNEASRTLSKGPKYLDPGLLAHDRETAGVLAALDWWPHILPREEKRLNALLRAYSLPEKERSSFPAKRILSVVDDEDDSQSYSRRFRVCILADDAMVLREYKVFTKRNVAGDFAPKTNDGWKGQVNQVREIKRLFLGLPAAKVKPGVAWGFPHCKPADSEDLQPVTRLESAFIMKALSVMPDAALLDVVRRQRLRFSGFDLLELQPKAVRESRLADSVPVPKYLLWKSKLVIALDRTAAPIYSSNEFVISERRGDLIRSEADAVEYTLFFCRHVWAEDGPFLVLKSGKDEALAALDYANYGFSNEYDFVEALDTIKYPRAVAIPPTEGRNTEKYEVAAWVLYGKGIFECKFEVKTDGTIEMTDDAPFREYSPPANRPKELMARELKAIGSKPRLVESNPQTASEPDRKVDNGVVIEQPRLVESEPEAALDPDGKLENKIIIEQLSAEALSVRIFRGCRFRGRLNLQHLISPRLSFESCVFDNGLDLSGANIDGSISFIDCKVREGAHYRPADSAKPFSVEGLGARQLLINRVESDTSLAASGMRISGAVQILSTRTLDTLVLDSLAAQSVAVKDTIATNGISLEGCVIEQFMSFINVRTTGEDAELNLYGSVVQNNYVGFRDVSFSGDLCATFLRVGTGFFIENEDPPFVENEDPPNAKPVPNWIGGSVSLEGAKLPQILRIQNTNIGKSITAKGIMAGEIRILGSNVQKKIDARTPARSCSVGEIIDLTNANIRHNVTIVDLSAGQKTHRNASLFLTNAKIDGNLSLFLSANDAKELGWLDLHAQRTKDFSSRWKRGIDLGDSSIGGDVDLRSIKCRGGGINLTDARIERNLTLRSNYEGQSLTLPSESGELDPRRSEASWLLMTGLECKGTTDISGLSLPINGKEHTAIVGAKLATFGKELIVSVKIIDPSVRSPEEPVVFWRYWLRRGKANAVGLVSWFFNEQNYVIDKSVDTALFDCLDLSGSTIGHLSVSVSDQRGEDLPSPWVRLKRTPKKLAQWVRSAAMRFRKWFALPRTKHDADTQGEIILRNARVEKFTAILRTSHRKRLYPNPIDLSFAEVKWWAFDPHSPKAGDDYKRLLAGDRDLQRHTFRSVEQNLINQGYEEAADEVHKDMRKWLRRHANLWNRFWWGIWDGLTDSTTSPKRLLIIVISWFFLSILLFRSPANIVPSAEGLSIHKNWKAGDHPADSLWGLKDGVWMALRYHVPVAAFTAKHEWQPAKDGRLIVPWPVPRPPSWLNAEDYANIVLAVHWIVLPIILLLTSRKLFRRVDK